MSPQEREAARLRSVNPVHPRYVYQPAYQFFVPPIAYRPRGTWVAPDASLAPLAGTIPPTQAPPIVYRNLKFLNGEQQLPVRKNRSLERVQAPPIETTY